MSASVQIVFNTKLRWVWRRDEVFHHRLKSHNSPRIIMLVAVSGYLGTVGSVKISMSQSIIYPTDPARHYNTFLPFSPPTSSLLSFNFWELQEITHSPLSRELYTEITGIACRLVFCVGGRDLFDFTRKIFVFSYQVWEAILGVMIFVWIHWKYKAGSRQREVWSQLISSSHIYLIRWWLQWINHSYRNWNL